MKTYWADISIPDGPHAYEHFCMILSFCAYPAMIVNAFYDPDEEFFFITFMIDNIQELKEFRDQIGGLSEHSFDYEEEWNMAPIV